MASKNKKRLILIGCLAIVFVTLVLNIHKIKFALGMYNLYTNEKNVDVTLEIEDSTDTSKEITNPLTPIIELEDKLVDVVEDGELDVIDNIADKVIIKDEPVNKWPDKKPAENNAANLKSYVNIIQEYNLKLESLRSTFEANLENLIEQGISEYKAGVSTASLGAKYLSVGTKLEKKSDSELNSLVKEMEKELRLNNHDLKVVSEVKEYYTSFKNAKKAEVIGKGMKLMK